MTKAISQYRQLLNERRGAEKRIKQDLRREQDRREAAEDRLEDERKALSIIQDVARQTQEQLEYKVSELASLGLASVLDLPYTMGLRFETKANNTQAHLYFERDGHQVKPVDASGGGAVDIAALCLQLTMWSIRQPRTRNLMVLDEPMTALKGNDMPRKGAKMLHEVSRKLGLQVIMVSHSPELIDGADNVFEIKRS